MKLLALRLCAHDSNISYFDGQTLHYYKSERFYQIKHHAYDDIFLWQEEIKKIWNVSLEDIDEIAIVIDSWNYQLPKVTETFFPAIEYNYLLTKCKVWRVNHHFAHSISTWMLHNKEPNVSIVIDGFGDLDKTWSVFKNGRQIDEGNRLQNGSIGIGLIQAGQQLGVTSNHIEDIPGKAMGLQSYGKIDYGFLDYLQTYNIYNNKEVFNSEHWNKYKQDPLLAKLTYLDWIKTIHYKTGQLLVDFFKLFAKEDDIISYTGGVAQNVIWNTELKKHFKNLIIPPHCADEGLSLGAIEWLRRKNNLPKFNLPGFPFLQKDQSPPQPPSIETIKKSAQHLADGKIVAWYQGHGEVGPRALGNRSILMNPTISNGKEKINKIKKREQYRPFGASILEEFKEEYFNFEYNNPYMLYVSKLKEKYSMECITHVDGTCRVQTVPSNDTSFRLLLEEFYKLTGCPVLLNTSLNLAGKPIAGYIDNAKELYYNSNLDCLVVGNSLYEK